MIFFNNLRMEPVESEKTPDAIYQSLSSNEVRFMKLCPAPWSEPIKCDIINFSVDEAPAYVALSYAWGDPTDTVEITLNDKPFHITTNLFNALRQLREFCWNPSAAPDVFQNRNLLFWIDALCINQANIAEKASQIPHIGAIYKTAAQVVAWLGTNGESENAVREVMELADKYGEMTDTAWEMTEDLYRSVTIAEKEMTDAEFEKAAGFIIARAFDSGFKNALFGKDLAQILEGFEHVYHRAWFRRVWVLQEVVLAQNPPLFFSGSFSCSVYGLWSLWSFLCGSDEYYHETRRLSMYHADRLDMYTKLRDLTRRCWEAFTPEYWSALPDRYRRQTSSSRTSRSETSAQNKPGQIQSTSEPVELRDEPSNDSAHCASEGRSNTQLCITGKEILNKDEREERTPIGPEMVGLFSDSAAETLMTGFLATILSRVLSEMPVTLQATVPHDYIYGIMSMIDPPVYPKALAPDYSIPYSEVYHRYARAVLESTGDLSFLPRTKNGLCGVPSWVPDFRAERTDVEFDSMTLPYKHNGIRVIHDGKTCITEGVHLGRIVSTYFCFPTSWSPQQDVAMSLRQYDNLASITASIRSSTKDQVLTNSLGEWFRASEPIPVNRVVELYNCAIDMIPLPGFADERKHDSTIVNQLESLLLCHSVFVTSEGMLGRLTRNDTTAKVGDVVAMMERTTDPFLLRPNERGEYAFIGNCRPIGTYGKPDRGEQFFAQRKVEEFHLV